MSYPPAKHLLRDLAFHGTHSPETSTNSLQLTAGLMDDAGVRLGALATLIDVTGAGLALHAVAPDWIATADLQAHIVRPVTEGSVTIECHPLRVGAGRVVVDANLTDDTGALCGTGRMAFARLPGSATSASIDSRVTMTGGNPIVEPLLDHCGMEPVGPGQIRYEKIPYIQNSFGTVNGGVLALSAEAAAVSAAGGGHASDIHVHYLEQIGDGPVAVTAEVVRDDRTSRLCVVRIEDRSVDRLVAVADVIVSV